MMVRVRDSVATSRAGFELLLQLERTISAHCVNSRGKRSADERRVD